MGSETDQRLQFVEVDRLGERQRNALAHTFVDDFIGGVCGDQNDRHALVARVGAQLLDEGNAIDVRHHQVSDDQIKGLALEHLHGFWRA